MQLAAIRREPEKNRMTCRITGMKRIFMAAVAIEAKRSNRWWAEDDCFLAIFGSFDLIDDVVVWQAWDAAEYDYQSCLSELLDDIDTMQCVARGGICHN